VSEVASSFAYGFADSYGIGPLSTAPGREMHLRGFTGHQHGTVNACLYFATYNLR